MACGYQTPFLASGVRGSCPVNGVGGNRALSANFLNKRYITPPHFLISPHPLPMGYNQPDGFPFPSSN